ncbi:MAG TPA: hypothetical protein VFT85_03325 [Acidimicrobiia bacterium]|nr:hypothetical protein [Acidimicrobiia bacterium]
MRFELGPYRIAIATEFGPRITSLRFDDGPEMFAELGSDAVITHDTGTYHFRGGHRLWVSPEVPEVTYADDDHVCTVEEVDGVITVTGPPDGAGLVKEISVSSDGDGLAVDHRITRTEGHSPPMAAWAITQVPLGGTAILPVSGADTTPSANRYLVLWPYTSLEDSRVSLGDEALELRAAGGPPIKFGAGPDPGRLGYFRDSFVFLKEIASATDRRVPDFGAVGQVYLGQGFCELESVGALTDLTSGVAAELHERWIVEDCGDLDSAIALTVSG